MPAELFVMLLVHLSSTVACSQQEFFGRLNIQEFNLHCSKVDLVSLQKCNNFVRSAVPNHLHDFLQQYRSILSFKKKLTFWASNQQQEPCVYHSLNKKMSKMYNSVNKFRSNKYFNTVLQYTIFINTTLSRYCIRPNFRLVCRVFCLLIPGVQLDLDS